jgi:AcrR family transcriptional regulator
MERAKKDSILDAAVKAFERLGFKKASIDDIARVAGVAKGTVYLACESKEDLFYQAVHRELRGWLAEIARIVDPRVPADEMLGQIAEAGVAYLEAHPLVRNLLNGLHDGQFPGWVDRFEELRGLGRASAIEILKLGQRQGRFRKDLDVEAVAEILQDLTLQGYVFQSRERRKGDLARLRRMMKAALDMVLNGLRA